MSLIIVIQNISALAPISDYRYHVLVGDGSPERSTTLEAGTIKGHARADGWRKLVRMLLEKEVTPST